jgi:uncharacterized protein YkwD
MRRALPLLGAVTLIACSNVLGYDDLHFENPDGGPYGTGATTGTGGASQGGTGGGSSSVCTRWKNDRADMSDGTWSGSTSGCNAGDISATGRQNALKIVNLYRFIAGLPEVTDNAGWDAAQQECALMMQANGALSHTPPTNWNCYTAAGAGAAGQSNIATTPGVSAIDLYMADPGNPTTIGHRRWILSNSLGPIATGSTSGYSCLRVIGGSGNAGKPWMGFPPAGQVPFQMFNASFSSVDSVGWTVQSDSINLSGAAVTVTDGGNNMPVTVSQLAGGYGSQYAIRFNPQGWQTQAGHTYAVSVTGVSSPINYSVEVVNCP